MVFVPQKQAWMFWGFPDRFLARMQKAGAGILAKADLIVPVPLHRFRLIRRRYNQAGLLAAALSKESGIRCAQEALVRRRATPTQGRRKYRARQENVRNAFGVNPRSASIICGKHVVLVDDVLTTGATVNECARALKKAGALSVSVLTIARTVLDR